ncbi:MULTISPECIES: alpha/beta hydrolase [Thermomonosporaceae]|uniref:alpha/beta hydrolase n=1 Tax=Thermomonosporaceae TaxID=2012 RepID=UPI00255ADEF4|nr:MULTISPECIES: alpha/beta hydrolase-fold protein [Thermomonosporaceae]MDL4774066.1 alpha/beta hydrolase-fold protein [Actinomadura xylanilytica]
MKKRTDRKIAVGGVAVTAVVLPGIMVILAQTGVGRPVSSNGTPEAAAGSEQPVEMPGPGVGMPSVPPTTSPSASPTPSTSYPFSSGHPTVKVADPDRQPRLHGKKTGLPKGAESARNGNGVYRSSDDGAKVTAVKKVSKYQFDVTIAAPALGSSVKTRVLVPKSWSAGATRTWPVVYAYHGGRNNYQSWTKDSNLAQVAAGDDVMVVMPEGGSGGSYTNWWNGGKGGIPEWETFHIQEVIQLMERNFHAGTARAAIGLSSGGQGAITYAERHPGLFRYAASYSGALNITAPGMPTVLTSMDSGGGVDRYAIWGEPIRDRANWQAHDATVMVGRLKGIGVYVSSGNGQPGPYDKSGTAPWDAGRVGENFAGTMNANFVKAARQAGVAVTANLYGPGTHKWAYWKRELVASWPAITTAIGAGRS